MKYTEDDDAEAKAKKKSIHTNWEVLRDFIYNPSDPQQKKDILNLLEKQKEMIAA